MPRIAHLLDHVEIEIADDQLFVVRAADLADDRLLLESLRLGGNDFIIAPYKPDELVLRIRRLLMKQEVSC